MQKYLSSFVRFLFGVKIIGKENEPTSGAYLICANHISEADPVMIGASLKLQPKYMAKKELMRIPLLKQLITSLGAFPIDRSGGDVGAIKKTIELLKNGSSVVMFPQGTRCKGIHPSETKIKFGCAMISKRAGVPVLPIYIKTKNYRVRPFKKTYIIIGKLIMQSEITEASSSPDDYKSGAELIFSRITELDEVS